jgi:hypothetical protein
MSDDMEVRPEEVVAVRQILLIAQAAGLDDAHPVNSTLSILASAYTTAVIALVMSGAPPDQVREAVRYDQALTLSALDDAAEETAKAN